MSSRAVYLTSDAHLGGAPPEMEAAFHQWLEFAAERAGMIVLNGDLFDFWFEWGTVVPQGHARTLGLLARIVDAGIPIHLMGGNHDWWGGSFLTDEIGLHFHRAPIRMEFAGKRTLLAHGDGLGGGDLGYRFLRRLLRNRFLLTGFRWLHPDLGTALARAVSRTDAEHAGPGEAHQRRSAILEGWARERMEEEPELDLVILGHTHIPRKVQIAPGRFYLNSGDWIRSKSYLIVEAGAEPRLESWP